MRATLSVLRSWVCDSKLSYIEVLCKQAVNLHQRDIDGSRWILNRNTAMIIVGDRRNTRLRSI